MNVCAFSYQPCNSNDLKWISGTLHWNVNVSQNDGEYLGTIEFCFLELRLHLITINTYLSDIAQQPNSVGISVRLVFESAGLSCSAYIDRLKIISTLHQISHKTCIFVSKPNQLRHSPNTHTKTRNAFQRINENSLALLKH